MPAETDRAGVVLRVPAVPNTVLHLHTLWFEQYFVSGHLSPKRELNWGNKPKLNLYDVWMGSRASVYIVSSED